MGQLNLLARNPVEPHISDPDFLTKQEADELFALCAAFPRTRPMSPFNAGHVLRRTDVARWNDLRTSRRFKDEKDNPPMDDAPWQIKNLAIKLSLTAGKPVNYVWALGYENEQDRIDWHQHREDRTRDARVFIVSLGETRTFGLREICPACRVCAECNELACDGHKSECEECVAANQHKKHCPITKNRDNWILLQPAHGSLITLPSDCNWTHEHAVLVDKPTKGLRISINTKCLPTEESLEDFITRMETGVETRPVSAPRVYDCHAGQSYPPGAVYVGRQVRDRRTGKVSWPATPFGNYKKLTGDAFRAYAADKMKDPAFRARLESLRGIDLLCWCRPHERDRCHAQIWLDLANRPIRVVEGARAEGENTD
jgi:hypothetical protein